jgi:hypothetical protein
MTETPTIEAALLLSRTTTRSPPIGVHRYRVTLTVTDALGVDYVPASARR